MTDRAQPITRLFCSFPSIPRLLCVFLAAGCLSLLVTTASYADVFGRLRFSVKDAATEKPLPAARITLHDTASIRPDLNLTTDNAGSATSVPLETRAWQISTQAEKPDTYEADTRQVTVTADTTTDIEVLLEPKKEQVITITGSKTLVRRGQTANVSRRDQAFLQQFPATAGNEQSLQKLLLTNPGLVQDSVNQAHPRGEHSSTSIYIDGFLLPGVLQGRAGQLIVPEIIQNADVLTGGYPAEFGSETAAILNLTLRSGTIKPFQSFVMEGGQFSTVDGILTFGGQVGAPLGPPEASGSQARRFRYLVSLNARTTANALEAPQPDNQTAHNSGDSEDFFGNFDYLPGLNDQFTFTINHAPARTDIANRAGLPSDFAPVGQGFGFGGARNADGTIPGGDPTTLGGAPLVLPSQQAFGQNIYQNDSNTFARVNYRHNFSNRLNSLLSFGILQSSQGIHNNNPAVNLGALPVDSSIEYNPDIVRDSSQREIAGSLTLTQGKHTPKAGFLYQDQSGDESYQLIPGSQLALNALAALSPNLAPAGAPQVQMDANGNPILDMNGNPMPVTDVLGNQVYTLSPGATTPVLRVHRTGYYGAGYLQDTWNVTNKFTANYGLRVDFYHQAQNLGQAPVTDTVVSPRLNLAYTFLPRTIGRVSYNHLFIQPPLAQGAILGLPIQPETVDQYDASVESQVAPQQVFKVAYYYKEITNQIDTGLLIPFTQIGVFTSLNFQHGGVHGLEISYDLLPRNNVGLGGYAAYTYSIAKPNGLDNTGAPAPTFNDHDQRHTLSTGLSYTHRSGAVAGMDLYYGSGVASSSVASIIPGNNAVLNGGNRTPHTVVNLRLGSPRIFGTGSLQLNVENLFDDRSVINFNSGFSGTRFVQGRRILISALGKF